MEFPNRISLIYDNSFQILVSKNFLWGRSHCSVTANTSITSLLLPLTIFLKFQNRYGGCDEVKGFPLDGRQLQPLKEEPRNVDALSLTTDFQE